MIRVTVEQNNGFATLIILLINDRVHSFIPVSCLLVISRLCTTQLIPNPKPEFYKRVPASHIPNTIMIKLLPQLNVCYNIWETFAFVIVKDILLSQFA